MKTINKKRNAARFGAARMAALAHVSRAAFGSGVARSAVIAACFAACGKSPVLSLYGAVKLELQVGFMAAALARKGDNRGEVALIAHCRTRLSSYAGFGGKGKVKTGQLGRRTKEEEEAYASARVLVSGVFRDAGVKIPETRGGDTSKTRGARAGQVKKAAKSNVVDIASAKPAVRRYKTAPQLIEYAGIQAAALLANVNRNAAIAPIGLKNAVQDFHAAIKALPAE